MYFFFKFPARTVHSFLRLLRILQFSARFGSAYTITGIIQRRLAWPLHKDDTQIPEVFHILKKYNGNLEFSASI